MVRCQAALCTQLLTHSKSATICNCHQSRKKGAARKSKGGHLMLLGIQGMLLSLLKIWTRIPLSHCGAVITPNKITAVKLTTASLFGCCFWGFYSFASLPFIYFFRLARVQYITSNYHTAMCLCQRQAKEI